MPLVRSGLMLSTNGYVQFLVVSLNGSFKKNLEVLLGTSFPKKEIHHDRTLKTQNSCNDLMNLCALLLDSNGTCKFSLPAISLTCKCKVLYYGT